MENSLFYCDIDSSNPTVTQIISLLNEYSEKYSQPIYVIKKALGTDNNFEYNYSEYAIILVPKHKICVLDYGDSCDDFNRFFDDFLEDLGYLSEKYDYKKILGRPREWKWLIQNTNIIDFNETNFSEYLSSLTVEASNERRIDLLISLLIGSINDVQKVSINIPATNLDKVKEKIILFDGMQSRFIYQNDFDSRLIKVQGLAGTGKTELLLHKLREIYVKEKNSKIAFTCFNKVLAKDMRDRIPRFFNFMKVEKQIEWDSRLFVFPSWGSENDRLSGLYSYICSYYDLDFKRYSRATTFEAVCEDAIDQLKSKKTYEPCFDYLLVDESQDFSDAFFSLCDTITRYRVYSAGDIFQNIFDTDIGELIDCNFLLNKCYRTDPKTLMFAHSVGMGLYEKPVIRWLDDQGWANCGYSFSRPTKGKLILKRSPLRRFEDIDDSKSSSVVLKSCSEDKYIDEIISCIENIRIENPTVKPDDIAVIFLNNSKINYKLADELSYILKEQYNWESSTGYITKEKTRGEFFISNTNNIKGLEFPFIICVETRKIDQHIHQRNSIYMVLTRSFLTSYFIINDINTDFMSIYSNAIMDINRDGYMSLREPSQAEKEAQEEKIKIAANIKAKSLEDTINDICKQYPSLTKKQISSLYITIPTIIENQSPDEIEQKTHGLIKVLLGIS